jgi:hypothetical protein
MRDERDYYISLIEERKRAEKQATPVAQVPSPGFAVTWTPAPPRYTDHCPSRLTGKGCRRGEYYYVHEYQVEMYKDIIVGLE